MQSEKTLAQQFQFHSSGTQSKMYEKLALNYSSKYFKADEWMLCDIGILIEICY